MKNIAGTDNKSFEELVNSYAEAFNVSKEVAEEAVVDVLDCIAEAAENEPEETPEEEEFNSKIEWVLDTERDLDFKDKYQIQESDAEIARDCIYKTALDGYKIEKSWVMDFINKVCYNRNYEFDDGSFLTEADIDEIINNAKTINEVKGYDTIAVKRA